MRIARFFVVFAALLSFASFVRADPAADAFAAKADLSPLRTLAVQHLQTMKTLDSYARQTLSNITGKSSLDGHDALFVVLDMSIHPEAYATRNLIKVRNVPLRKEFLRLPGIESDEADRIVREGTISAAFWDQPAVGQMLQEVMAGDNRKAESVQQIANAAGQLKQLLGGESFFLPAAIVPPPSSAANDHIWKKLSDVAGSVPALAEMAKQAGKTPQPIIAGYDSNLLQETIRASAELMLAWKSWDADAASKSAAELAGLLPRISPDRYPPEIKRQVEVIYNRLAKMTVPGAAFYFLAFTCFLMNSRSGVRGLGLWGIRFFAIAFLIHTIGIGVRWWLVGSIPIKNQFESVMFSAWFGALVGLLLELWKPRGLFGAAASFVGWLSLLAIFAAPFVFGREIGGEIGQVNGVLMSYWLYIHVTMVTASYALIGMGFLLSIWWLVRYYREGGSETVHSSNQGFDVIMPDAGGAMTFGGTLARVLFFPVANEAVPAKAVVKTNSFLATLDACNLVVLQLAFWILGAGIIFGAIWADMSWGRPWGWDPKETFALVTWIVYLIVVHVRVATVHKGWWTAILSVIGFFIMLFNWIGVNFFLVGLHSYA